MESQILWSSNMVNGVISFSVSGIVRGELNLLKLDLWKRFLQKSLLFGKKLTKANS